MFIHLKKKKSKSLNDHHPHTHEVVVVAVNDDEPDEKMIIDGEFLLEKLYHLNLANQMSIKDQSIMRGDDRYSFNETLCE